MKKFEVVTISLGIFAGLILVISFNGLEFNQNQILTGLAIAFTLAVSILTIADMYEKNYVERFHRNVRIFFKDIRKEDPWERWNFTPRTVVMTSSEGKSFAGQETNPKFTYEWGDKKMSIQLPTVPEDCFDLPIKRDLKLIVKNRDEYIKYHLTEDNVYEVGLKNSELYCLIDILRTSKDIVLMRYIKEFSTATIFGASICTAIYLFNV